MTSVILIDHLTLMPTDKPIRPLLPAPPTILVTGALHLPMTRLLFATLWANWRGPLGSVEQRDSVEEGHLSHLIDFHAYFLLYLYLNLGWFTVGASRLLVLPIPTEGAPLLFPGFTLVRLVSPFPTAETLDLARVTIHEDRHFYRSSSTRDEGCRFRGGSHWRREGPFQLILDQTIKVRVLDTVLGCDQVLLDNEILLGDLIEAMLRISAQLVECGVELQLPSEAVNFPNDTWVGHICNCLIDKELLRGSTLEFLPLGRGHLGVEPGLSTDVDGDGVLGVASPCSSSDIRIVGVILYVLGKDRAGFLVPFFIEGVWDMDGVEVSTVKFIENETVRCRVGVFDHTFVVDAANRVLLDWKRANSQLRRKRLAGGVVDGGIVRN